MVGLNIIRVTIFCQEEVNRKFGDFLYNFGDVKIDLPDNPNWESFKFQLQGVETMSFEAWMVFIEAQIAD